MNLKCFQYKAQILYYFVKDIQFKEVRGKEMADAYMVICDENMNQKDFLRVYDEKYKVLYAMPIDAEKWYKDYLKEKSK